MEEAGHLSGDYGRNPSAQELDGVTTTLPFRVRGKHTLRDSSQSGGIRTAWFFLCVFQVVWTARICPSFLKAHDQYF